MPRIAQVTPAVASPGDPITVIGQGMGEEEGYVVGVRVGGEEEGEVASVNESVVVSTVTYVSPTQISFVLPSGVGVGVPIHFITSTSLLSTPQLITYAAPTISSITPTALLPGEVSLSVTLCGSNFPPREAELGQVTVGGLRCVDGTVDADSGCVTCTMDTIMAGETWREEVVRMVVAGQEVTANLGVYVPPPTIESISPQGASTGDVITIDGGGFGGGKGDVLRVEVGGEECIGLVWVSSARVRCTIPSPHPIWVAAAANPELLVPFVDVVVVLLSGMESKALEGTNGNQLVPGGGIRTRPDPDEAPLHAVAWRDVGQSGVMTVRWRFPGSSLEQKRIAARKGVVEERVITGFTVEVARGLEFDEEKDDAFSRLPIARDSSIDGYADATDSNEASLAAWERHQVTISSRSSSPLYVRVQATNSDGVTNWTLANDPDNRPGMPVNDGMRIPETCQQDEFLSTHESDINNIACYSCPEGAVCGGLGARNVTALETYWRVPWSKDQLGFARCLVESACQGHGGSLRATSVPESSSTSTNSTKSSFDEVEAAWEMADASDRSVALSNLQLLPSENERCVEGHRGVLCSACATNYFPGVGGGCTACGNRSWIATRFALLACVILAILSILLFRAWSSRLQSSSKEVQITKIIFTHLQTVAIVGSVQLRWPSTSRGFFDSVTAGSSFASSGLAIECLMGEASSNPFLRTILILIMPLFLILYIFIFWGVFGAVEDNVPECDTLVNADNTPQSIADEPAEGTSPTIAAERFEKSKHPRSREVLMSCGGSCRCTRRAFERWKERMILSLVVLAFLVHTPLTTAAFRLMTCRSVHAIGDDTNNQLRLVMDLDVRCDTPESIGAIAGIVTPMILLIALGLPVGVALFLRHIGVEQLHATIWRERIGFLTNGYRDRYFFWESIVLLRKVFLAFTTTTLAPTGGGMQVTTALLVVLLAMALHARAQPYSSKPINMLEGMALVTGAVTLVCGQFVTLDELGGTGTVSGVVGDTASIFLIIINVIFFSVALTLLSERARKVLTEWLQIMQERIGWEDYLSGGISPRESVFRRIRQSISIGSPPASTTSPFSITNPMAVSRAPT